MKIVDAGGRRFLRWGGSLSLAVLLAVALAPAAPIQAFAQSVDKRVDRLEKEVRALQRRVFSGDDRGGNAPAAVQMDDMSGDQAANYEVRLTALENQLRTLTGQLEEMRFRSEETARRLETFMADTEFRFNELGGGAAGGGASGQPRPAPSPQGGGSAAAPIGENAGVAETETGEIQAVPGASPQVAALPEGTLPVGTPVQQYEYAYGLLAQGKYDAAEAGFRAFLDQHGKHELAGNANYWLAQSYYVRSQYERAAKTFLEGYQTYPNSSKAPDYLLKIGMSLSKIDQKQDACAVFSELETRYPDSPAAKERLAGERKAAGC